MKEKRYPISRVRGGHSTREKSREKSHEKMRQRISWFQQAIQRRTQWKVQTIFAPVVDYFQVPRGSSVHLRDLFDDTVADLLCKIPVGSLLEGPVEVAGLTPCKDICRIWAKFDRSQQELHVHCVMEWVETATAYLGKNGFSAVFSMTGSDRFRCKKLEVL